MQKGQPIYWDDNGTKRYGIVIEVLANKAGVKVIIDPKNKAVAIVSTPHKVKDAAELQTVLAKFGVKTKTVPIASPTTKPNIAGVFDKAMAEIEAAFSADPGTAVADKLRLNSMGFTFVDGVLPIVDEHAIPVDKMFF